MSDEESYNFDSLLDLIKLNVFEEIAHREIKKEEIDDIIFLDVVQNDPYLRGVKAFKDDVLYFSCELFSLSF
ncbi:MAG: hypothetical protein ACJAYQ_003405 [Bacteriovoracaceae bacterium]